MRRTLPSAKESVTDDPAPAMVDTQVPDSRLLVMAMLSPLGLKKILETDW